VGAVQPTRQSSINDTSKNMMDKEKKMKMKSNPEILASAKMAGIMNYNPFHVLQFDELDTMAKNVGINLGKDVMQNNLIDDAREVISACPSPTHVMYS
jgi:hypothetical protein